MLELIEAFDGSAAGRRHVLDGVVRHTAAVVASGQRGDVSLVARAEDTLLVSKTGVEDNLFNFAHGQSLIYGLLCVLTALTVGWLGGVIFRRD